MTLLRYYEDERYRQLSGRDSPLVAEIVSRGERLARYTILSDDIQGNLQYYYFIRSANIERWLVKRIVVSANIPSITYANVNNNPTITNINQAIPGRETLTYSPDVEIP